MLYLLISNLIIIIFVIFLAKIYVNRVLAQKVSSRIKGFPDHFEKKVRERTDELMAISSKLHKGERHAFLNRLGRKVTHELRNPLAVLKNSAYFLDKSLREQKDENILKYIDIINNEITRIDLIMSNIMGFVKTKPMEFVETDVTGIIEKAISRVSLPERIKVKKEFEDLPKIRVNVDQVVHAIVNIINNAIIAMKGNGILTFRASMKNDRVCIEIEDNGPGISPDLKEMVFEPLYSSKPKGIGLGLPIARIMVENQNGKIGLESEPGKGTVVSIFLPLNKRTGADK